MAEPGTDYPAAHSMDTNWFAVDGAGNVGVFWPNEGGSLPLFALDATTREAGLYALIEGVLRQRASTDNDLAAVLPADTERELWTSITSGLVWRGDQADTMIPVLFDEAALLQPAERVKSSGWDRWWPALDRRVFDYQGEEFAPDD